MLLRRRKPKLRSSMLDALRPPSDDPRIRDDKSSKGKEGHMKRSFVLALALSAGLLRPAEAQNLLVNGTFATNVSSWTPPGVGGTLTFDGSRDANGSATSGSAAVANTFTGSAFTSISINQCVSGISAGTAYYWGGRVLLRGGETATGNTHMPVSFFDGAGCTGTNVGGTSTNSRNPATDPRDTWLAVSQGSSVAGFTAPAGAVSAYVSGWITKAETTGDYTANFDDLFFAAVGTTPVTLLRFDVE
jgi:hypothetical protein